MIAFDVLSGIAIIYSIIEVPLSIGFQITGADVGNFNYFVDAIFFMGIVLAFNTAYLNRQLVLVTDRIKIAEKYATFWLWIDLASTMPFDAIATAATSGVNPTVRLIRLLRIVRLFKLAKLVQSQGLKNLRERLCINPSLMRITLYLRKYS